MSYHYKDGRERERENKGKYSKKTAHHIKDNNRFSDPGGKFNIGFSVEVTVRLETGAHRLIVLVTLAVGGQSFSTLLVNSSPRVTPNAIVSY